MKLDADSRTLQKFLAVSVVISADVRVFLDSS